MCCPQRAGPAHPDRQPPGLRWALVHLCEGGRPAAQAWCRLGGVGAQPKHMQTFNVFVLDPDGPTLLPQASVCHPGRVHQCRECGCGGLHLQPLQEGRTLGLLGPWPRGPVARVCWAQADRCILPPQVGITLFTVSHRKSLWKHHEVRLPPPPPPPCEPAQLFALLSSTTSTWTGEATTSSSPSRRKRWSLALSSRGDH